MTRIRNFGAILALSGLAALPACSMFGGGDNDRQARSNSGYSSQSNQSASAQPNYSSSSASTVSQQTTELSPLSPDMIKEVQQRLQQEGLYHGAIDGVWGPRTEAALRSYQQQHNLNATGRIDQQTLTAMNLVGSGQSSQQGNAQQQPSNQQYSNYNPPPNNNNNTANQPANSNAPTNAQTGNTAR